MTEKKKRTQLMAALLLLFFLFPTLCHSQETEGPPLWLKPTPENSRPAVSQDKERGNRVHGHSNPNQRPVSEYRCMPASEVEASCKIVSKESGYYYCLSIDGKEHRIPDMIDYGELDLKVYTSPHSRLLLVGLTDLYESVYFVYYFKDDVLARLGQVDITQPGNVEEEGAKKVSFKVKEENKKIMVRSYLDGAYAHTSEFLLKSRTNTANNERNQE